VQKEHEARLKKKYDKPKVTVIKLQIEERLMACLKHISLQQRCRHSTHRS